MCTWTESHTSCLPLPAISQASFSLNNIHQLRAQWRRNDGNFRRRIQRWMDLRFYTGFSEWLSNVYYDEDLTACSAWWTFQG